MDLGLLTSQSGPPPWPWITYSCPSPSTWKVLSTKPVQKSKWPWHLALIGADPANPTKSQALAIAGPAGLLPILEDPKRSVKARDLIGTPPHCTQSELTNGTCGAVSLSQICLNRLGINPLTSLPPTKHCYDSLWDTVALHLGLEMELHTLAQEQGWGQEQYGNGCSAREGWARGI
ncbi:hypothetical protein DSO57_1026272 [Entomophthora muscae]|uniref:Uncharacterized protein n=1 Tax=Entomophthora muscae TaxID=34485 RepID=A0ACC2RT52_9FUNG|nr:hypothetical protein DSO57_1026272 [Entomophthora muscae]